MRNRTRLVMALFVCSTLPALVAQTGADPSGHWEGTVQAPEMELRIEVDLARTGDGHVAGTFGQPDQGLKGLPLGRLNIDGRSVRFEVLGGEQPVVFDGTISDDGQSLAGSVSLAGVTMPFHLARHGDARVAPPPVSPPIAKALEGRWQGVLQTGARHLHVRLTMTNESDGTATGSVMSPDAGGIEIPIAMVQKGATLAVDVPSIAASFVGQLNAAGTELIGTWTQGPAALPLTLRRADQQ